MYRILFLLSLLALSCTPKRQLATVNDTPTTISLPDFDWQGHRGARGLLPENTVPAFLRALDFPKVTTLELDLAVSKDQELIVSHEPWMSALICSHPDGSAVTEEEEKGLRIFEMTTAQVQAFDCGQRGNVNFPDQAVQAIYKPTLTEVVEAAEEKAKALDRPLPFYNIEIKSLPEYDGVLTPEPSAFAALVVRELRRLGIAERSTVQSFDVRSLQAMKEQAPKQRLVYLIANRNSLDQNMELLGFTPDVYSPYFELCTPGLADSLHEQNIQLIPWTVNEAEQMNALIEMGVDGIITDYPDRIPEGN
ncbi:MAG: glycerophosphodiester phosphodiesterase family protein [Bacteroidota bacterium]